MTLESTGDTGWLFESWSGDTTVSDTTLTITMKDNVSVTAGFKIRRTIVDIKRPYAGQIVQQDSALFRIIYSGYAGDTLVVGKSGGVTTGEIGIKDTGVGLKVEKRIDLHELGVDTGSAVLEISYLSTENLVDSATRMVRAGEKVDENEVPISRVAVNFRGADNDTVSVSGDFEGSDSVVVSAVLKLKDMDKSLADTVSVATAKLLAEDNRLNNLKELIDSSVIQIETSEKPDSITLNLYYSEGWISNLPLGRSEEELRIHRLNESTAVWEIVADSQVVNTDSKSLTVKVDEFSVFALSLEPFAGSTGLTDFIVGPNPFRAGRDGHLEFQFNSDSTELFEIEVYTVTGRRVLKDTTGSNDKYEWHAADKVASGYYIYRVKDRETGQTQTGKLAIIR